MSEPNSDLSAEAAAKKKQREAAAAEATDIAYTNPYMSVLSRGVSRRQPWLAKRKSKVIDELERNRRGEHRVPTWVLAAALIAVIAFWVVIVATN